MTLADARARLPDVQVVDMDPVADAAWLERIADWCERYTPMLQVEASDGLTLDITGCAHLFGGEAAMRDDVVGKLSKRMTQVCSAIAGTPHAARALARYGPGTIIVPQGEDAKAVAPLRIQALEANQEVSLALSRAGLKTIGDLASRPSIPLTARFSAQLTTQLLRTLGEENIGITPRRPLPPCSAERTFGEPITQVDDALATLHGLATQVAENLEKRGEGGRCFVANLFKADGDVAQLMVETARPMRSADMLIRLLRERIDTLSDPLDPGYGYDLIRLAVTTSAPYETPQNSLDGNAVDEDDVYGLIDRLHTRFGKDSVVRLVPVETHIPEKATRYRPAGHEEAETQATWSTHHPDHQPERPLLLFARPHPIEALAEIPDGPPLKFRWRRVLHEIACAEGPERIAPEWWETDAGTHCPTRDYYRIEDAEGRRFWVYRDGLYHEMDEPPRWYLHGVFA